MAKVSFRLSIALTAACCALVGAPLYAATQGAEVSDSQTAAQGKTRTSSQSLDPITIDKTYLRSDIPAQGMAETLTLRGAVSEAAIHNKDVREAVLGVNRFKWDYLAAETGRLPNVRILSYLGDQTINSFLIPKAANAFLFMSALFPVTQQYKIGLEAGVAKYARRIAAAELKQRIDESAAKVKAAYYKMALDQSLLEDVQDTIKYLLELKSTVDDEIAKGSALKVDTMEVAARLAKSRLEELKTQNAYNIDQEKLNHLLGRNLKGIVTLETIPPPDELELNVANDEQIALSNRPEIIAANARVRQVNTEKKLILAEYIPNVSVGLVYIALPGFNNQVLPKNTLAPGIFMNWNAFDWGRKIMLAKARSDVEKAADLKAQDVREEVLIDLHSQINKLTEARQQVDASQLGRSAAREQMRVSLNRYKHTAAEFSDVLLAQSNLSNSNNEYHQALLAFWEARAEFERALGNGN